MKCVRFSAFVARALRANRLLAWHCKCPVAHTKRHDYANETRIGVEQNAHTIHDHCLSN
jgi:hypothetical protein